MILIRDDERLSECICVQFDITNFSFVLLYREKQNSALYVVRTVNMFSI